MMGYDPRFDQMDEELDSWRQWRPKKDQGVPNPLVIVAEDWVYDLKSDYGNFDALHGIDRHGNKWSVSAVGTILVKGLIEGVVEEWDDAVKAFRPVGEPLGRVESGEVVGITYEGEGEGAKFTYSKFKVKRLKMTDEQKKDLAEQSENPEQAADSPGHDPETADLPF